VLGVADGVALGEADGVELGVADGVALGVADGVALGVADGVALGVAEGAGLVVGDGVLTGGFSLSVGVGAVPSLQVLIPQTAPGPSKCTVSLFTSKTFI
jgi:hypothetical protein